MTNQHFSAETLAEIQRMKARRQGGPPVDNIDWSDILEELEIAAHHYDLCFASVRAGNRLTPQQTLNRLTKLDQKIAAVLHELEDPQLMDWYFISPTFPTGPLILEFCRQKLNLFKGR
jgi:hypothetical protein